MKTEEFDSLASRLTEEEIIEFRERVFSFEQERSKERAPIRYMLIGGIVFAASVSLFTERPEIERALTLGVIGVVVAACAIGWYGKVERNREAQRILQDICDRRR